MNNYKDLSNLVCTPQPHLLLLYSSVSYPYVLRIISRVANNFQNFTRKHKIAQYLCERINWWKKYVHITSKNVQYKHHFAVKQLSSYTQISQKGENLLLYHTPLPQDTPSATGVEGGGSAKMMKVEIGVTD